MNIKIKIGIVEIEYSEPTTETSYPRICSFDVTRDTKLNRREADNLIEALTKGDE